MASRAWRPKTLKWETAQQWAGTEDLARRIGTAPLVAQVLANRGITDATAGKAFLNPKLSDLHDPEQLQGTRPAADRIAQAVEKQERIVIYGDYDVDGITAIAILHACLKLVQADVHFYVPHRLEEGYGVNAEAIEKIIAQGAKLLITVDCGISAAEPLTLATRAGLDVIVTDHHSLPDPDKIPDVTAIVHPAIGDYPNRHLAGAGVAYKLAWEVARTICGNKRVDEPMRDFLLNATCLGALGTIADVVPLLGENRSLTAYGLRGLPASSNPGLQALLESVNLSDSKIDAYHVGFVLAPRINACGRMGHARLAVELLTNTDPVRCKEIAQYLAKQNTERRRIDREITQQAIEMVESSESGSERRAIVLWSQDWHGGVIGIVASRLVERFSCPVVLMAINGDRTGQGSARSVPGFHMRDALAACGEHLISFGGHAMAGGLRIDRDNIESFAKTFTRYAGNHVTDKQLTPTLKIDAETTLAELNFKVAEHIMRLGPFGQGNPRPIFAVRNCRILTPPKRMGRSGGTVGLLLGQGEARMRAVGFGMGELVDHLVGIDTIDLAAQPVLNTFNGRTSVELQIKDVRWE